MKFFFLFGNVILFELGPNFLFDWKAPDRYIELMNFEM